MKKELLNKIDIKLGDTMGISRKTDVLGRIVIPIEFRKELGIAEEERPWLEMFLINGGIYIRPKKFKYKGEL